MDMRMKNKSYDRLKNTVTLILPAFITMVGTIGTAMNWEHNDLAQTIMGAVALFIGVIVKVSSDSYQKEEAFLNE